MADFLINPNMAKSLILTASGLLFLALPCALKPDKVPAALSLAVATAAAGSAIIYSRRWEEDERNQERLDIVEAAIVDAQMTAQTMGAIDQVKREYLPHLYLEPTKSAIAPYPDPYALPAASESEPSGQFEEFDLAAEAAASDKSLLVSGITGVGKTRFVQHFIHAAHREYAGEAVFDLISFKSTTEHFCGLEKTRYYIESGASGTNYEAAADKVQSVVGLLDRHVADLPYYFIADEVNNGLKQAEGHIETEETPRGTRVIKTGKQATEELKRNLSFIVTQGRERKIRGVFTAHGNLMSLLGIDGDTAQSLVCAVLGRKVKQGEGFSLIDKALSKGNVFFSTEERRRLVPQYRTGDRPHQYQRKLGVGVLAAQLQRRSRYDSMGAL